MTAKIDQLFEDVNRIKAAWLEWLASSNHADFGGEMVQMLVEVLDAHGRWYLAKVKNDESLPMYAADLRRIGAALLDNAVNPYYLRVGQNEARQHAPGPLPPDMLHAAIVRFEGRYAFWYAEALRELRNCVAPITKRSAHTVGTADAQLEQTQHAALRWEDVEIRFRDGEKVQIRRENTSELTNYAGMGFSDARNSAPNSAWHLLCTLAKAGGTIPEAKRPEKEWETRVKKVALLRRLLRRYFRISSDPLPFIKGIGYKAVFKTSCSSSFLAELTES